MNKIAYELIDVIVSTLRSIERALDLEELENLFNSGSHDSAEVVAYRKGKMDALREIINGLERAVKAAQRRETREKAKQEKQDKK